MSVPRAPAHVLAALSSLHLSSAITKRGLRAPLITVGKNQVVRPLPAQGGRTAGRGTPVGTVYRLADGRLVYVAPRSTP